MASTINTFGLTYLTISMYQMLRGFELIFFCLWSKIFLKNNVYLHQGIRLGILIFGLTLVDYNDVIEAGKDKKTAKDTLVDIILMFVSQFFSITYYILQENFLKKYDINPFQLVGF